MTPIAGHLVWVKDSLRDSLRDSWQAGIQYADLPDATARNLKVLIAQLVLEYWT